jgi:hypothetical protein
VTSAPDPTAAAPGHRPAPRALVVGWSSFLHGEATAGDVLSMRAVRTALGAAGVPADTAWSRVMCAPGGLRYDDVNPAGYDVVVFACGPLVGPSIAELHERFAQCRRVAVGVSVVDPDDPAATGFDAVLARDAPGAAPRVDLAAAALPVRSADRPAVGELPVVGVFLSGGQAEYGERQRHDAVTTALGGWLTGLSAAVLSLDTRLDPRDWRQPRTAGQLLAVLDRLDLVVTTRLHGLVLGVGCGVPVLAVDPVAGGGKVTDQARALGWPAVLAAEDATGPRLEELADWCWSTAGRSAAGSCAVTTRAAGLAGAREAATLVLDVAGAASGAPVSR